MPSSSEKRLEQQRRRRQADPEKFAAWGREWRARNAERVREYQRSYRESHLGQPTMAERESIEQDLRAMRNASNPEAVFSITRAMAGLGRWTPRAEQIAEAALRRLGVEPTSPAAGTGDESA